MSAALTALGTADAFFSAGRGHSCFLIEDERGMALVDCGATALQALARAGVEPARIDAVHLTHLHGDHFVGLAFLLVDSVYRARRTSPLVVTGPPGTAERLQALWATAYPDAARKPLPFALDVRELSPGESALVAGRRIEALRARHQKPPQVALSLRLHTAAGLVAFTGDTGPHPGLTELAEGARVLVTECTDLRADPALAERRHLAWDDLRALLPALGVPRVLLAHLGGEARAASAAIEAEARALGIDLRVLDDGDRIVL